MFKNQPELFWGEVYGGTVSAPLLRLAPPPPAPPPTPPLRLLQGNLLIGMQEATRCCGALAPSQGICSSLLPFSFSVCRAHSLSTHPPAAHTLHAAVTNICSPRVLWGIIGVEERGWCATLEAEDFKTGRLKSLSWERLNVSEDLWAVGSVPIVLLLAHTGITLPAIHLIKTYIQLTCWTGVSV